MATVGNRETFMDGSQILRATNSIFNKLYKLTAVVQFLIIALFVFIVIQMISTSQYFVSLLIITSVSQS
jgi:large-conductance mechanosensitive channel